MRGEPLVTECGDLLKRLGELHDEIWNNVGRKDCSSTELSSVSPKKSDEVRTWRDATAGVRTCGRCSKIPE